jgi:lipopolysaccharide export system permease protein
MIICCTLGLVSLSSLIKYVDEIRHVGRGSFDMFDALICVLYTVPGQIVMFFPLGVLLGTVLALGSLASTSELIVMQSLAKSRLSIVWSACKSVIPLIIIVLLIGEFIAPKTDLESENYYTRALTNGQVSVTNSGIWFKEGSEFINISEVLTDGSLKDIRRYTFSDGEHRLLKRVDHAKEGYWQNDKWIMKNVVTKVLTPDRIFTKKLEIQPWNIMLSPDKLDAVGMNAAELSLRDLHGYISYMKSNGQKVEKYVLAFYRKIFSPITTLVVLLLAASTIFGPLRSASMGARVVVGIIVGFTFYAINEILAPFTIFYGVPPIVGASLPTIIVLVVAILLLKRRT